MKNQPTICHLLFHTTVLLYYRYSPESTVQAEKLGIFYLFIGSFILAGSLTINSGSRNKIPDPDPQHWNGQWKQLENGESRYCGGVVFTPCEFAWLPGARLLWSDCRPAWRPGSGWPGCCCTYSRAAGKYSAANTNCSKIRRLCLYCTRAVDPDPHSWIRIQEGKLKK